VPALVKTLGTDDWATVRLLAADSLGMIHAPAAMDALRQSPPDENKDVSLHLEIARTRETGLERNALDGLLAITEKDLESAAVGGPAPGFVLPTTQGQVSLANYSGKYAVALYFLYGDG
jgi:hypothetical protein